MTQGIGLQASGLSKSFKPLGAASVQALDGVGFTIQPGEFVVVVGHNGSGKSTLLRLLAGELDPDAGTLILELPGGSTPATTIAPWARAQLVAKVVQDPTRNVIPTLLVEENLALVSGIPGMPSVLTPSVSTAQRQNFQAVLSTIGIGDKLQAVAGTLSFGQQQLLALQMAFLRQPALLLLDEPTAALDRRNAERCLGLVETLWRQMGSTVVMVTHDLGAALRHGNRLLVLADGRIEADLGSTEKAALSVSHLMELCGFALPTA